MSLLRLFLSAAARTLYRVRLPLAGVTDYTVGFRAYRTDLLRRAYDQAAESLITSLTSAATVELLLRLVPLCERTAEIPLKLHYERKQGAGKIRILDRIRDGFRLAMMPG